MSSRTWIRFRWLRFSTAVRPLAFKCKAGCTTTSLTMAGKLMRACIAPPAKDFILQIPRPAKCWVARLTNSHCAQPSNAGGFPTPGPRGTIRPREGAPDHSSRISRSLGSLRNICEGALRSEWSEVGSEGGLICINTQQAERTDVYSHSARCLRHVWTAPSWQGLSSRRSAGRCSHVFGLRVRFT